MPHGRTGWDESLDGAIALPLFAAGDDPAHLCVLVRTGREGIGLVGARTTAVGLMTAGCIADAAGRTIERVNLLFERVPGVSLHPDGLAGLDHQRRWAAACGEGMGAIVTGYESRAAAAMYIDPHGPRVVGKGGGAGMIELLPVPGRLAARKARTRTWAEHGALIDRTLVLAGTRSAGVTGRALMSGTSAGEAAVEWLWLRARLLAEGSERIAAFTRANARPLLSVGSGLFAVEGGVGVNGGPPDLWTASPVLDEGGTAVGIDVPGRGLVFIDPARCDEHGGLTITLRESGTIRPGGGWAARGEIEGLPVARSVERAGRVRLMDSGGVLDALAVVAPAETGGGPPAVTMFASGGGGAAEMLSGVIGERLAGGSAELGEVRGSTDDLEDFAALAVSCLLLGDQAPSGEVAGVVSALTKGRGGDGVRLCAGAAALPGGLRARMIGALEAIAVSAARVRATAPSGLVDAGVFEEATGALRGLCAAARSMLLVDFGQAAEVRSALRAAAERLGVGVG